MSIQTKLRNTLGVTALTVSMGLMANTAGATPRIVGPVSSECRDTLTVANAVFHSTAFRLDENMVAPRSAPLDVANVAGDYEAANSHGIFKILPQPTPTDPDAYGHPGTYWQIAPTQNVRWVIVETPFNWRGDFYTLYAIDPATTETGFVATDDEKDPRVVLANEWTPAAVLRNRQSGEVWAVDTQSYDIPAVWTVYAAGADGVKARCTLTFGPKVKTAFDLLPAPVRALAVDLDGTLGDGRNEGTLHPTGQIRDQVQQAWTNIALRPWALTWKPYHSRRNADLGLRHWSRGAPSFRALYQRIQADYPAAVAALADLYVQRFGKTPQAARALAEHNLDFAYRIHFVFPQAYIHPPLPAKAT